MGMYIEPRTDKLEWLRQNGKEVSLDVLVEEEVGKGGVFPVVLVDNGMFYAGGVAYSERELLAFARPDERPKFYFQVTIESLLEVLRPDEIEILEKARIN